MIDVDSGEPAEEWLNRLAREAEDDELYPESYTHEDVVQLCHRLGESLVEESTITWLLEDTTLSEREAEVIALKMEGVTHEGIALFYNILSGDGVTGGHYKDGPTSSSTVDEYSRRARNKYHRAKSTVKILKSMYDE